jgi:hypothetical protein
MEEISAVSRATDLRFRLPFVSWAVVAPPTWNFEILKSLKQTQESKKIKITCEIFVKLLDGLNFGERCLLECSIWIFFRIDFF